MPKMRCRNVRSTLISTMRNSLIKLKLSFRMPVLTLSSRSVSDYTVNVNGVRHQLRLRCCHRTLPLATFIWFPLFIRGLIGLAALCGTAHHSTVSLARTPFYLSHSADVSHTVSHVVPCREKRHFTARAAAYAATRAASVTSRTITQTQASAASAALAPISTTPSNQL